MSTILSASKNTAITLFCASIIDSEPVILPTDTIYGIGAPLKSVKANRKIYEIKNRPLDQPFPVLIANYEQLHDLVGELDSTASAWLKTVWPGEYTVIMKALPHVNHLYTKDGKIAIRMLKEGWLRDAIADTDSPITATSVNISGTPPLRAPETIALQFKNSCKYMLWGTPAGEKPSTVVDITDNTAKIIRA